MSGAIEELQPTEEKIITVHYVRPDFQLSPDLIAVIRKTCKEIHYLDPKKDNALIPSKTVVKSTFSKTRQWLEGQSMLFVSEKTTIPVPTVFAVLSDGSPIIKRKNHGPYRIHILMEHLPGETLDDLWSQCSSDKEAKRTLSDRISKELKLYVEQLRAIEHPEGFIGTIDGGPILDTKFAEVPNRGM